MMTRSTSLTIQFDATDFIVANVITDVMLRSKSHSTNGSSRNSAAPLTRWRIETRPDAGRRYATI